MTEGEIKNLEDTGRKQETVHRQEAEETPRMSPCRWPEESPAHIWAGMTEQ